MLAGTAVLARHQQPCWLDDLVVCDSGWHTISGKVAGWVGNHPVEIELAADSARRWWLNGLECPAVAGCLDLDLNFTPSTNLLPIRRLELAIGLKAEVQAAYLRFPSFALEPLVQLYRRINATTYRYESAGGRFVTELQVNTAGFVTSYPDVWQVQASTYTILAGRVPYRAAPYAVHIKNASQHHIISAVLPMGVVSRSTSSSRWPRAMEPQVRSERHRATATVAAPTRTAATIDAPKQRCPSLRYSH